ncbi:MAG: DUF3656 domain-containing protein, partial [Pontiellaceae bacterium]|nr:DUF3656 domain-containing protein [Pontiellaceae bacterium]
QFRQRHPLNIVIFQSMETLKWVASADGVQTELVLPGPFEPARQPEKAAAAIRQCVEKLGDTDWKLDELTLEGPAVFVPVSVLNEARRRLIDDFSSLWKSRCRAGNVIPPVSEVMDLGYRQKTDSEVMDLGYKLKQVVWSVKSRVFRALEKVDEFVLEIDPACPDEVEKARVFYGDKLRLALPVIIRDEEVPVYRKLISECRSSVTPDQNRRDARSIFSKWEAANIGGLNLLQGQTDITADWPLYTLNTQAALQWRAQGVQRFVLSPEEDAENLYTLIKQLGDAALVPVYQHTPLMISATRPAAAGTTLTDRSRRRFRIESSGHEFVLTNETPFSLADRLVELKARGARHFRIDLSYGTDSANEAADLVCRIMSGRPVPGHSGNFDRTLE